MNNYFKFKIITPFVGVYTIFNFATYINSNYLTLFYFQQFLVKVTSFSIWIIHLLFIYLLLSFTLWVFLKLFIN